LVLFVFDDFIIHNGINFVNTIFNFFTLILLFCKFTQKIQIIYSIPNIYLVTLVLVTGICLKIHSHHPPWDTCSSPAISRRTICFPWDGSFWHMETYKKITCQKLFKTVPETYDPSDCQTKAVPIP